jgi:hypothetical protein
VNDLPRGPLGQQPDEPGWWQASDSKWYPPESMPTAPVPVTPASDPTTLLPTTSTASPSGGPLARVKSAPLWAKIAVPIAAVLLAAGIAGANGSSNKKATGLIATTTSSILRSTSTTESATTSEPPTTEAPTTVATTLPPTTAPRPTLPPVTQPPATSPTTPPAPPPTQGGPANPGDSKNCSDFATYAQAKSWFDTYFPKYGDVAHLDADHDGIPCESLPGAP